MRWLTLSPLPLALAGVLYLAMAVAYWRTGQMGMVVAFVSYAVANIGFIVAWYEVSG
jgi:hypothetical protein